MNDARQDSIHMDDEKPGAQVVETSQHEQSSDHPIFEALLPEEMDSVQIVSNSLQRKKAPLNSHDTDHSQHLAKPTSDEKVSQEASEPNVYDVSNSAIRTPIIDCDRRQTQAINRGSSLSKAKTRFQQLTARGKVQGLDLSLMECAPKESSAYVDYLPDSLKPRSHLKIAGREVEVTFEQLISSEWLGKGSFGSVSAVKLGADPTLTIAVKYVLPRQHKDRPWSPYNEWSIMRELTDKKCQYVVHLYGALVNDKRNVLCLCMERMDTSLEKFYQTMHRSDTDKRSIWNPFIAHLVHGVISGLANMFKQGLSHYDVKPANILISKNGTWKICDFGECGNIADEKEAKGFPRGTKYYHPPEYNKLPRQCYSVRADMWALGVSLVEVIMGQHPHPPDLSDIGLAGYLDTWKPVIPIDHISMDLKRLILCLLDKDPAKRPESYSGILKLPCMAQITTDISVSLRDFIVETIELSRTSEMEKKIGLDIKRSQNVPVGF